MSQIVDLSQPYGGQGKYGGSFKAIAGILDTIGKVERLRQERSLNAKVINVVAMGGGPQQIAQVLTENQPTYSTGAAGFLQQIAEQFAPPSMIEGQIGQMMMKNVLQDPLDRRYKEARIKYYERESDPESEKSRFSKASHFMRAGENLLSSAWQEEEESESQATLRTQAREMIQEAVKLMKGVKQPELKKKLDAQLKNIRDEETKKAAEKSPVSAALQSSTGFVGPPEPPEILRRNQLLKNVKSNPVPKNKKEFDNTLAHIPDEEGKDLFFKLYWKPEYGTISGYKK